MYMYTVVNALPCSTEGVVGTIVVGSVVGWVVTAERQSHNNLMFKIAYLYMYMYENEENSV